MLSKIGHYVNQEISLYIQNIIANLNLGNKEQAKSCYEQTLLINPEYEKGKKALEDLEKMKN